MLNKLLLAVILFFGFVAFGQSINDDSSVNWKNAEGYISIEKNGNMEHYIVVNSENSVELIPVKENPAKMLKNKMDVLSKINNGGK